jgi:hypothetical protein
VLGEEGKKERRDDDQIVNDSECVVFDVIIFISVPANVWIVLPEILLVVGCFTGYFLSNFE